MLNAAIYDGNDYFIISNIDMSYEYMTSDPEHLKKHVFYEDTEDACMVISASIPMSNIEYSFTVLEQLLHNVLRYGVTIVMGDVISKDIIESDAAKHYNPRSLAYSFNKNYKGFKEDPESPVTHVSLSIYV